MRSETTATPDRTPVVRRDSAEPFPPITLAVHPRIHATLIGENSRARMQNVGEDSWAICLGCQVEIIMGDPNPRHISTSYIDRQDLTMRMSMRRFTRLTNGFSKKLQNHTAAAALHYMPYNFARIHKTLRVTAAMQAGLSDHVWSLGEVGGLLDSADAREAT